MNSKDTWIVRSGRVSALVLGALCTSGAWAATPGFAAQQVFATGSYPYGITNTDVNGDGKPDLITTNEGDNTVSVLLNDTVAGDTVASFFGQQVFATGSFCDNVTAADLNGDGKPDLIAVSMNDGIVSVLVNTTASGAIVPSFAAQQTFAVGAYAESVKAVDVNGDGLKDLVVTNFSDMTVSVLINTTAPGSTTVSFADQQVFSVTGPFSLVMADVNGDGLPDIVTADYGNSAISVLLNTTTPGDTTVSFAPEVMFDSGNSPVSLMASDVNGDGKVDFIVANAGESTVSVILNTTATGASVPSFAAPQAFSVGNTPMSVKAMDVDGDGKPDLVAANYNDNTVSVLINTTATGDSTLSFSALAPLAVGMNPQTLTIADVNGDGKPDIIVTNNSDGTLSVLLNTSN